ncbi:hypothetical protein [Paraburkholderia kirstenboschensis]|uniref:hypothetical protein n=1 Tax=Paraburkholderia kirstenboschensis TaxID=1245436 RepID=UPI001F1BE38F|nr:hypothetical protein [Paraburkholderia kirstenboschensis]
MTLASDAMICVAAPELPQIGSSGVRPELPEPPHADRPPTSVAPAEVPANTMKARRPGEAGSARPEFADVAPLLPLLY